jgi:hypothetical protein
MTTLDEVAALRAKAKAAQAASSKAAAQAEQWGDKLKELDGQLAAFGLTSWDEVPAQLKELEDESDAALVKAREAMDGAA